MKAAFSAEAIGWGFRVPIGDPTFGMRPQVRQPWVAEITGLSARYGYRREFLQPKRDYTRASSSGARGVHYWWTLEAGRYYEADYPVTWSGRHHCFLAVTDEGEVAEVDEEEVRAWLEDHLNVASVSTS